MVVERGKISYVQSFERVPQKGTMVENGSENSHRDLTVEEATIVASVNVLFSILGIFGNVLVFTVVARNRQLHTVTNVFIISLAFADMLVCVVAQPMYAAFLYGLPHNPAYSAVRKSFTFVSLLASISSLAAVTIDRYTAIVSPMMYQLRAKFKCAAILLSLIWTVSLALGILSGTKPRFPHITIYYTLALVAITVPIYVRIYFVARRQARTIARQVGHINKNLRGKSERENIAAKTIGYILAAFVFCWFPIIVMPMIHRYGLKSRDVRRALKWAQTLAMCSSAVNPIIYSFKTQIFRKELKKIYRLVLRRSSWEDKPEYL